MRGIMLTSSATMYYARINLHKLLADYDSKSEKFLSEKITDLINNENVSDAVKSDYKWRFGDIIETENNIFCKLGKIRKVKEKTIFDQKNKKFIQTTSTDEDVFISHIFFDKKRHFFIFEERRPEIGYKELIYIIEQSFKKFYEREISIDLLPNKLALNKILEISNKITRVKFVLKPSNPDDAEDIKTMENIIRDIKAKKATIDFTNIDGLKVKDSKTYNSGNQMVAKGFGNETLEYIDKGGKKQSYNSKNKIMKETIKKPVNDNEWKSKFIDMLNNLVKVSNQK